MKKLGRGIASVPLRSLIGAMMAVGLGSKRGTLLNKLRLALWSLLVSTSTAVVLVSPGCLGCYVPVLPPDTDTEEVEEDEEDEASHR